MDGFSGPTSCWREELTWMLLKHGCYLISTPLERKISEGQILAGTRNFSSLLFMAEIVVNETWNFFFVSPSYEVYPLAETPLCEFRWYPSDQKSSGGHSLVTTHISFLREIIAAHVHHNVALPINFSGLFLRIPLSEVIHRESSRKRLDDSTPPRVMTVTELTDPT